MSNSPVSSVSRKHPVSAADPLPAAASTLQGRSEIVLPTPIRLESDRAIGAGMNLFEFPDKRLAEHQWDV